MYSSDFPTDCYAVSVLSKLQNLQFFCWFCDVLGKKKVFL